MVSAIGQALQQCKNRAPSREPKQLSCHPRLGPASGLEGAVTSWLRGFTIQN